jgi:DNA-binding LytR/AlgR family response regulator
MINCVIIEDEPLAIEKIMIYISKLPSLNLLQTFNSGVSAIPFLKTNQVDLIFLDIEMKELTGIQLLESINIKSKIIITTAYEKYALKGFELQVSDYLLKPISFERFVKAIDKVSEEINQQTVNKKNSKVFIKTEYRLEGIETSEILYIEGMGDYRRIVTSDQRIMTLQTFKELLDILPAEKFCRVHNSFIVAINKIKKIERNRIVINEMYIPISNSYSKDFFNKINT